MIYLLAPSILAFILAWTTPKKYLWVSSISASVILSSMRINLVKNHSRSLWHKLSPNLALDSLSSPLTILRCWLVPISLIARIKTLKKQRSKKQRIFISLILIIFISLIITFSALELSLFYVAFETTLLPTLTLIARWGAQKERYQARIYFLFYTLAGSLPLLLGIIALFKNMNTINLPSLTLVKETPFFSIKLSTIWWMACLLAFCIKMPIYGLHLWLPKAHVEAPVAGSMILAAILLKLGGYGLIRTITIFYLPSSEIVSSPLISICVWGALVTRIICLRQTDLKALIAYSSVGHMRLVASGVFSISLSGIKGALILMIAHGLVSSALFCLANMLYERKDTRTLSITRGFKLLKPLLSLWWVLACVSKLGLPPTPNLTGELLIVFSIINWKIISTPVITISTVFGAIYSLLILRKTKKRTFPKFLTKIQPSTSSEHTLMSFHMIPLLTLILRPKCITI